MQLNTFQMERYIRTQSTPPGMAPPPLQQQQPQQQQQRSQQQQVPPQQQPSAPSSSQFANPQVGGMKKVPSNASLDRVITTAKMVALQSK